jgi:hypothetical protein
MTLKSSSAKPHGFLEQNSRCHIRIMCNIEIPEEVVEELLQDLPEFIDYYMYFVDRVDDGDALRHSMRWYLWNAVTCAKPVPLERRYIDLQISEVMAKLEARLDVFSVHPKCTTDPNEFVTRFVETYQILKDNRFVPYFKRVMFDYELERFHQQVKVLCDQNQHGYTSSIDNLDATPQQYIGNDDYRLQFAGYAKLTYAWYFKCYCLSYRPVMYGFIPGETITLSEAYLNDRWIWAYMVMKACPYVEDLSR